MPLLRNLHNTICQDSHITVRFDNSITLIFFFSVVSVSSTLASLDLTFLHRLNRHNHHIIFWVAHTLLLPCLGDQTRPSHLISKEGAPKSKSALALQICHLRIHQSVEVADPCAVPSNPPASSAIRRPINRPNPSPGRSVVCPLSSLGVVWVPFWLGWLLAGCPGWPAIARYSLLLLLPNHPCPGSRAPLSAQRRRHYLLLLHCWALLPWFLAFGALIAPLKSPTALASHHHCPHRLPKSKSQVESAHRLPLPGFVFTA